MRKRILLVTLLVTVVGILLMAVFFSEIYYRVSVSETERRLQTYIAKFDPSAALGDESARALSEELFGTRVTFLLKDGTAVGDSHAESAQLENHADREEVQAALAGGEGFSVRGSETLGADLVYYCRLYEESAALAGGGEAEGFLVRLSAESPSGYAIFTEALPSVIWILLVDILACLFVAWLATSFVLRPVEKLTQEAARSGGKPVSTPYSELQPLAKMMNEMNAEINEKADRMREDRSIEKLVLRTMEHGILIFRSAEDVLLINETAARLLGYEQNEPIALFTEDVEVAAVLAAKEAATLTRRMGERDYNLRFTFNKDSNVLLISDVTELMAALRTKNDFIANVTHEMNTPLTSIRGFAELIAAGGIPPQRIGSVAKTIIKQSDRLANLIRSIINFSAIDSDELPDYEVDLTELVREAIGSFEPKLAQKHLALRLEVGGGVRVMSRREGLLEIFNNLVSNAIRYNKEGGELAVRLTGGETPVLSVSDTGIGLSEEDKTRIFDRFYTVDKSHNGSGGGFGLGLAIVKKLCRRAGWKLSVESELGEGTTFSIGFCKKQ